MSENIAAGQTIEAPDLLQLTQNIADGSVYQPGATFKNDQTTGIYRDYQSGYMGIVYKQNLQITFGEVGPLVAAPPTDPMGVVNKQYVDNAVAGVVTGVVVGSIETTSSVAALVPDLPDIPLAGGMCLLNGTIVAQDPTTRDTAMWNITLLVKRIEEATLCTTCGDTTPSLFWCEGVFGTLSDPIISTPILGAGSSGPMISLSGLATPILWDVNLNSTIGS